MKWPRDTNAQFFRPAMDEETCATAIAYGMMAVEGIDCICLGEVGVGNDNSDGLGGTNEEKLRIGAFETP